MNQKTVRCFVVLVFCVAMLCGCKAELREYYSDKANYVTAVGVVVSAVFVEDTGILYLNFESTNPKFDDYCFKAVGNNAEALMEYGSGAEFYNGKEVQFITAPKYFGDGYVMPIVSVSYGEEVILEFEAGYESFIRWLNNGKKE